jgi:hypothetical protein
VNLHVGRPFQAVVATKKGRFRRPEKGVLHFFTASEGAELPERQWSAFLPHRMQTAFQKAGHADHSVPAASETRCLFAAGFVKIGGTDWEDIRILTNPAKHRTHRSRYKGCRLMKSPSRRSSSLVKTYLPHNNCPLFNSDISAEHRSNAIVGCEHRPRRHRPSGSTY